MRVGRRGLTKWKSGNIPKQNKKREKEGWGISGVSAAFSCVSWAEILEMLGSDMIKEKAGRDAWRMGYTRKGFRGVLGT